MKTFLISIASFFFSFPLAYAASGGSVTVITLTNPLGANDFTSLLQTVITNLQTYIIPPIVVGMILIGAFQMLFAAGDPEKFSRGRKTILYTVIGYMIVLAGSGIVGIINDLTGAAQQVQTFANKLLGILQTFFWVIAAIMIMVSAYKFLAAGQNEDMIKSAKKQILYTVIAIIVALVATAATAVIRAFLEG